MKLILATTNPGKLREIKEVLSDLPIALLTPDDLGERIEIEETGDTFEENAILKAKAYVEHFGLPAIADDGGLEIDALNGEPGVLSHRWFTRFVQSSIEGSGVERPDFYPSDEELIGYTLGRMYGIPLEERGAQLRAVGALVTPDGEVICEEEIIRGIIAEQPTGKREAGYPYRSLFWIPEFEKFYVDLTPEEHTLINHRLKMLEKLKSQIGYLIKPE